MFNLKKLVACDECKHIIYKKDAQIIPVEYCGIKDAYKLYYCPQHRKEYTRIEKNLGNTRHYKDEIIEVKQNGTILKK
jgi:hypothetical protein